jgi:folylpolyglutamate synthase
MLSAYQSTKGTSLKIGCLTSPHLTNIRERIRLDSSPISQQLFAAHFSRVWHVVKSAQEDSSSPAVPGYPGFLSLLAIYIFVQEKVDIAIIETGIGGERDSTNVIPCPLATGIATIGLDHVNTLGDTIESIAWHKSGIFKKDSPAFTVHQEDSVLEVLQNRATEKRVSGELCVVPEHLAHRFGVTVDPDMPFQRRNASLAIALTEASLKRLDPDFSMTARLARRLETTKLPGRSETIRQGKFEWYISSAHNELSIEVAAAWFKEAAKHPE